MESIFEFGGISNTFTIKASPLQYLVISSCWLELISVLLENEPKEFKKKAIKSRKHSFMLLNALSKISARFLTIN
jgi:hypothetical protein